MVKPASDDLNLDVLAAGRTPSDPSSLMSSPALVAVFEAIGRMNYSYVLIDSPPILGLSDTQFLARQADDVLLVARLDRVTPTSAEDVTELLARLKMTPIGVVVIGARAELSPYYLGEHTVAACPEPPASRGSAGPRRVRPAWPPWSPVALRRRMAPAQISAAMSHRTRQCRVSTKKLLAANPHQAASRAAALMPYGVPAVKHVGGCERQRTHHERDDRQHAGQKTLLGQRPDVEEVAATRRPARSRRTDGANTERMFKARLQPEGLGAESLRVISSAAWPVR